MGKDDGSFNDRVKNYLEFYKFPLILGLTGIIFLGAAIGLLIKNSMSGGEVIFTSSRDASPSASLGKIQVDIEGAVISPGVYTLPFGSRVADALIASGGLAASADRSWAEKNLNRAAKLTDGGKIYIPKAGEVGSAQTISTGNAGNSAGVLGTTSKAININTASQSELEALPGVGPVTAGKIISGRPYQSVDELKSRKIVGASLFGKIKDMIVIY